MEDKIRLLADLLRQTKQDHGKAYADTQGKDPEWPIWYADYLADKLPAHLGVTLTRSDIVYLMVHLSQQQPLAAPGADWADYYARYLLQRYD
jgi:hypothetical protein